MKSLSYLFILCLLFSAIILSCSKSYNATPVGTVTNASIGDVFSQLSVQPAIYIIDAGTGGTFYAVSGTRYFFPANAFQDANGVSISGNVQISACEYLDKGDILFSKMLPISNNEPLLSGGEISVSASQNGNELFLKPGMQFQAFMPVTGTLPAGLAFFSGTPNADTTQAKTNWVPANTAVQVKTTINISRDSIGIVSDSLKQCNADAFLTPEPPFRTFTVTIQVSGATLSSSDHVYGYTFYDFYKAEWPLGLIGSYANGVFMETHVPTIPVHFVIFTMINGQFYGGIGSATPVTGQNYTVTISQVDPLTFKQQVSAL